MRTVLCLLVASILLPATAHAQFRYTTANSGTKVVISGAFEDVGPFYGARWSVETSSVEGFVDGAIPLWWVYSGMPRDAYRAHASFPLRSLAGNDLRFNHAIEREFGRRDARATLELRDAAVTRLDYANNGDVVALQLRGDLAIDGISRPVQMGALMRQDGNLVLISGQVSIALADYGITRIGNRKLAPLATVKFQWTVIQTAGPPPECDAAGGPIAASAVKP